MNRHSGFTLVEVVMVTLLVAILSGVVYGTIAGFSRSESISKEQREMDEIAAGIFSKMMFELSTVTKDALTNAAHQKATGGPDPTPRAFFGQHHGENESQTVLHFACTSGGSLGLPAKSNLGPIEVVYTTEKSDQQSGGNTPRLRLVREEYPVSLPVRTSLDALKLRARRNILTDKLTGFSLSFYSNTQNKWSDAFIQGSPSLPNAVQIAIELTADSGKAFFYKTAIVTDAGK